MPEITPNEKAATFIGFEPCLPSHHKVKDYFGEPLSACSNCSCEWLGQIYREHVDSDRDMTLPANYMRALEAVVAVKEEYRDRSRSIKFRHQPWVRGANWAVEIELIERTFDGRWAASPGEAAMLLLAQLFDEEHRNG